MKAFTSFLLCILTSTTLLYAQPQKKWTPPPVVDLQGMILEDKALAAKTIRKSWGEKSLRAGTNKQMQAALEYKDYDLKYWWGIGFHDSKHGAVMLPEMLDWLWKE